MIKRLERRQKIMVIAVAMNTILMVAAALVLFYFAYIGRFDYFESARLVIYRHHDLLDLYDFQNNLGDPRVINKSYFNLCAFDVVCCAECKFHTGLC